MTAAVIQHKTVTKHQLDDQEILRAGHGFVDLQACRLGRRSPTAEEEPSPTTESDPYGTAANLTHVINALQTGKNF
jgi:hypothetical protein